MLIFNDKLIICVPEFNKFRFIAWTKDLEIMIAGYIKNVL